jgi:hypothetical protein
MTPNTISPPEPTVAPIPPEVRVRNRQFQAVDVLLDLLSRGLPPANWNIGDTTSTAGTLHGGISKVGKTEAVRVEQLTAWAGVLGVEPLLHEYRRTARFLYAIGEYCGVEVTVWVQLDSAPVQAEAGDEVPA